MNIYTVRGSVGQKLHFCKNSRWGGRLPSRIWIFHHKDICVTFGMRIDSGHARVTVAQHPTFGKTEDGGCVGVKAVVS